jgi:tetratricopeptide (TPR) repeat protein
MEEKTLQKTVSVTIDLNDIDGDIEQLYLPLNEDEKRAVSKKILGLPDNFRDVIDFKIKDENIHFFWYLPKANSQAEKLHKNAIIHARKGDLKKAIEYWTKAAQLNPQDPDYFFNLGVAYFEIKRYIEAIDALTRTLAICPIYYKANLILGTAYLKIRKFENARKHIEKSLIVNKNSLLAYLNLGAINSILKDYKNGIAMFEKAIALSPKEASAYMGLAKIYATLDNIEKANFYFRKVIEFDKKGNLANYAKRLITSQRRQKIEEEPLDISEAANPEESYSEGYRNYIIGNFQKSVQMYKKYLTTKSDDDYVWCALGEAQLRAGKPELATESFKKAAKLSSSKGLYFKELGIAFDKMGKFDKVVAAMAKANELGKLDSITYYLWGKALYELGKSGEAIDKLEESLKVNKNNLSAKYYMALALSKENELNDAIGYLDEILNAKIETPLKTQSEKLKQQILNKNL